MKQIIKSSNNEWVINPEWVKSLEKENAELKEQRDSWLWAYSVVGSILNQAPGWEDAKETHFDGGPLEVVKLAKKLVRHIKESNQSVCSNHVWPHGVDSEGSAGPPMCVWCQRLRIEALEKDLESMQREVGRRDMQAGLIQWLEMEKYRVLMHRHDGTFRAVDEAYHVSWESDTLERLLTALNDPKYQPVEKAP